MFIYVFLFFTTDIHIFIYFTLFLKGFFIWVVWYLECATAFTCYLQNGSAFAFICWIQFWFHVINGIKEFDHFSSLSGYKINWSKSAIMPINNVKVNSSIPSFIPIKESFTYLGITIYKNIHKIARDNFNNILVKVKNDIERWKNLKVSLQGRISTVKINLLPRFNCFSLCYHFLPLQVTLRRSTPQFLSLFGMINAPELNLPHYNILIAQEDWLYQILVQNLRFFIIGLILNLQFHGGWLKLTMLNQIDFKIFYLLAQEKKGDNCKFGPVVANSIKICKTIERRIGGPFKYCNSTPLWHNLNFVCGNCPFVQPSWSSLGINTCGDIYDNQGLCSFQTLRTKFCLPASAYFIFLQLRSALKAYGVPWFSSISSHPMRDWIAPSAGRPFVSLIYNKIIDCITKPLSIKTIWNRELSDLNLSVDWERVWSNLSSSSYSLQSHA